MNVLSFMIRIGATWVFIELLFYAVYIFYLKPRAHDISRNTYKPFRDYDQKRHPNQRRHQLFVRILERLESISHLSNENAKANIHSFLRSWFFLDQQSNVETGRKEVDTSTNAIIDHNGIQDFLSWAFFDKFRPQLENWERDEVSNMINILEEKHNIVYPAIEHASANDGEGEFSLRLKPRRFTLEKGNPLHRPFLVYFLVWIFRQVSYQLLRFLGYKRFHAKCDSSGNKSLSYWYKAGSDVTGKSAILFFHGIAPGGVIGYFPLLRHCFLKDSNHSSVFLFENLSITYHLSFETLTEEDTVYAVDQALQTHGSCEQSSELILCGHSFGTFQLTWMLKAQSIRPMIKKLILLDPVSILLSNPDVVLNFLYSGGDVINDKGKEPSCMEQKRSAIRAAASSELFIEYYLRRHFAWYNSELWIEDIPDDADVHIFLSENDPIINASDVRQELDRHCASRKKLKCTFWKGCGHGDCVINFNLWNDVASSFPSRKKLD